MSETAVSGRVPAKGKGVTMSTWGALGAGTRVLILGSGAVMALGSGYLGWTLTRPAVAPVTQASIDAGAAPTAVETPGQAPAAAVPLIDTWRVAPDGEALVAGLAAPEAAVEVLVDGVAVASGTAEPSGEFVLQFTLQPNDQPSLMVLAMTPPLGERIVSEAVVALGPIAGPPDSAVLEATAEASPTVEEAAPAALLLTSEGAVVLQSDTPTDPVLTANVMIDTIAYTATGEVQIGGRGLPGAGLRVYVDNAEKASVLVPESGQWLLTLADTPPGIYTLRVDQIDAEGKVTSRFETPFKRETLEELALVAGLDTPVAEAVADVAVAPAVEPVAKSGDIVAEIEAAATGAVDLAADAPDPSPAAEPVASGPISSGPVALESVAAEGVATEPLAADPATDPVPEPVASEPVVAELASVEMAAADPIPTDLAPVETAASEPPIANPAPVTVTVQPGFTLWGIAQENYGEGVMYVQVFEANRDKIGDPDMIYPGQVFSVPAATAPSP